MLQFGLVDSSPSDGFLQSEVGRVACERIEGADAVEVGLHGPVEVGSLSICNPGAVGIMKGPQCWTGCLESIEIFPDSGFEFIRYLCLPSVHRYVTDHASLRGR